MLVWPGDIASDGCFENVKVDWFREVIAKVIREPLAHIQHIHTANTHGRNGLTTGQRAYCAYRIWDIHFGQTEIHKHKRRWFLTRQFKNVVSSTRDGHYVSKITEK